MLVLPFTEKQQFLVRVSNYTKVKKLINIEFMTLNERLSFYLGKVNLLTNKIELSAKSNISEEVNIICNHKFKCYDTTKQKKWWEPFEFLKYTRDPWSPEYYESAVMVDQKIWEVQEAFQRIEMTQSYEAIVSSLWYGTLPCMIVEGISGRGSDSNSSILKNCTWRGIPIECAAIFTTFPTDLGMCCVFNLKAADEIYKGTKYTTLVSNLQAHDKKYSEISNPTIPDWYMSGNEPKTIPGRNKGLFLMLDAHTDLLSTTSMDNDYTSFKGLISYRDGFPYMAQEGFEIRPGVNFINILCVPFSYKITVRHFLAKEYCSKSCSYKS